MSSIPNYVVPQMTIKENLEQFSASAPADMQAVLVGPRYEVARPDLGNAVERTLTAATFDYQYLDTNGAVQVAGNVDINTVGVFVKNALQDLTPSAITTSLEIATNDDTLLVTSGTNGFSHGATLFTALAGRAVRPGDLVRLSYSGTLVWRKVTSIVSAKSIRLDQPTPLGAVTSVKFYLTYTGLYPEAGVTPGASSVAIAQTGMAVPGRTGDANFDFTQGSPTFELGFRWFVPYGVNAPILEIRSGSDIQTHLFGSDLDTELGFAASCALTGSQGVSVLVLPLTTNDANGYTQALLKLENTDKAYAMVPAGEVDVASMFSSHVSAMSAPDIMRFRRAYVGADVPVGRTIATGVEVAAVADWVPASDDNRLVTFAGVDLVALGVVAGDFFGTDEIQTVLSATQVLFKNTTDLEVTDTEDLMAGDTPQAVVSWLKQKAQSLRNRRVTLVWADNGTAFLQGSTRTVPNRFIAAEIAGIRSALPPQQGLTRTEVRTVTDVPGSFSRFSRQQLDEIAAAGVLIVAQDMASGAVFIRHQLTTGTQDGPLGWEDSVGVNVDSVKFMIKAAMGGFIGKRNATDMVVAEIRNILSGQLEDLTEYDAGALFGPQLVEFSDLVVRIHPILRDTIEVSVRIVVPLPLNRLEIVVNVAQSLAEAA